jgi:hypothetical protein
MSYSGLLKQDIQIKRKTGLDRHGREVTGTATSYKARFERHTRNMFLPNGSVLVIVARVFLPNDALVALDDELIYDGTSYRVVTIHDQQGKGARHHITAEVVKWQK